MIKCPKCGKMGEIKFEKVSNQEWILTVEDGTLVENNSDPDESWENIGFRCMNDDCEISQGDLIELTEEMKKEAVKVLAKAGREEFVHLLNLDE